MRVQLFYQSSRILVASLLIYVCSRYDSLLLNEYKIRLSWGAWIQWRVYENFCTRRKHEGVNTERTSEKSIKNNQQHQERHSFEEDVLQRNAFCLQFLPLRNCPFAIMINIRLTIRDIIRMQPLNLFIILYYYTIWYGATLYHTFPIVITEVMSPLGQVPTPYWDETDGCFYGLSHK